jgi:4-hydroxy-2-oxoheptanedioate aldolase
VLDAGSLGVTCPMISTAAQAEQLVRYCTYPPSGERSTGPLRASLIYGSDYRQRANDLVNIFPMIETAEAVDNIEAICAVDGINGVYIGAVDLAQSMGKPGGRDAGIHPDVAAAIEHVLAQAKKRGLIVGQMAPNAIEAKKMIARGYEFVGISTDYVAMITQVKAWISTVREA